VLNGYRYVIYHPGHSRRLPGGAFGLLAFRPGSHSAFEDHLACVCIDGDPARVDLGTATKGFFDLALDLGWLDARLELDRVDHAADALEPADRALRLLALIIPFHMALERHPSLVEDYPDLVSRERKTRSERRYRVACDLWIGPLIGGG